MRLFQIDYCESGSTMSDINPRQTKDSSPRYLQPLALPPQGEESLSFDVTTMSLQ